MGALPSATVVTLERSFIERCLGIALANDFIITTLEKLDFKVSVDGDRYTVTVPTWRATKDVSLPEDIVEEVGRFFGYENMPTQLPRRFMTPFDLHSVDRTRLLKQFMAQTARMHEVYNYALHDEAFLRIIESHPDAAISVVNPVSENWRLLVTSLIPGLLKNVYDNSSEYEQLRFFEWGRTWQLESDIPKERKKLSGIMVNKSANAMNFYEIKDYLTILFNALNVRVEWEQLAAHEHPWFEPYQTAAIKYAGVCIGVMGKLKSSLLNKIVTGEGYAFELEGDFLLEYRHEMKKIIIPSKYPVVERDISMLVKDSMMFTYFMTHCQG